MILKINRLELSKKRGIKSENLRKPQTRPKSPRRTAKHVLSIIPSTRVLCSVQCRPRSARSDRRLWFQTIDARAPRSALIENPSEKDSKVSATDVGLNNNNNSSSSDETACPRKASLFLKVFKECVGRRLKEAVGNERMFEGSFEFESAFRTEPSGGLVLS